MTDHDAIRARHVRVKSMVTSKPDDWCIDGDLWPCDAYKLGVALEDWQQRAHKWHRMALAAEDREQRLRAALAITNPEWLAGYDKGVAALATTRRASDA